MLLKRRKKERKSKFMKEEPGRRETSKSVLITGASSGIGLVLSQKCLNKGFHLTTVVRQEDRKGCLPNAGSNRLTVHAADLADTQQVERLTRDISRSRFDYVVHNAGTAIVGPFDEVDDMSMERVLRTNLITPMRLTRTLLPQALKFSTKFIFISSLSAHFPSPQFISYSVSKAGLSKFAQGLRAEYPSLPVLCVEIGAVDTPMHTKSGNMAPDKRFFRNQEDIGERLFSAMLKKTGVVTLDPVWAVARKYSLWTDDFLTRQVMKRAS